MKKSQVIIGILLVAVTLGGDYMKENIANTTKVKFVLDSYYNALPSSTSQVWFGSHKVDALKRASFVKFSFIGLRNEQ